MSNKINKEFRLTTFKIIELNNLYQFQDIKSKKIIFSLNLPEGCLLVKDYKKKTFKLELKKKNDKKLKQQLGFIVNFLNEKLKFKNQIFYKKIYLKGTGFKVFNSLNKNELVFKLGLSHFFKIAIPKTITFDIIKINEIKFSSNDKIILGSFLNFLINLRVPDSYKGRGILLINHKTRRLKKGKVKN